MSDSNGTSIVASYPDDWGFELFVYYNYTGFNLSAKVDKVVLIEGEIWNPIITTDNPNVVWYYDANYQYPIKTTEFSSDFAIVADEGKNMTYGTLYLYGRIEIPPVKVLDENGVKVLFDLLSLQDYPNNDVLTAVINAIDATKLDKNNIFIGTKDEYTNAFRAGKVPVGAIVVLTDIEC